MAEVQISASMRADTGKGASRRSRAAGKVPAVIYGHGMAPLSVEVDRRELLTAFHTDAGTNVLLDIKLDGETTLALTKEIQRDPVRGILLHADFVKVDRQQSVEVEVPLHLIGEARGAKEGGVVEQPLFSVHVRCKVTDVPESIDIDISDLGIGDALRVADLPTGESYEVLNEPDATVASVAAPISEAELEAMVAEAGEEAPAAEVPEGEGPAEEEAPAASREEDEAPAATE